MVDQLLELHRAFRLCSSVDELFCLACEQVPSLAGYDRGLILAPQDGALVCAVRRPLEDERAELLRRHSLSTPVPLYESDDGSAAELALQDRERLASLLGLGRHVVCAIAPAGPTLAFLVLDRAAGETTVDEAQQARLFGLFLGLELDRLATALRLKELSTEFRHLTASAHALLHEAIEAPVGLTVDLGPAAVFTQTASAEVIRSADRAAPHQLSDRETAIATLLVDGRTNKEIGDALHLAPDTVKTHVKHVVRKLGAANRVEAAARYVAWTLASQGERQ